VAAAAVAFGYLSGDAGGKLGASLLVVSRGFMLPIRACYREEARLDRTLNPAASPTSGILGKVKVSKAVLDFPDFGAWREAWDAIENPVHKGYHLAALLTGCRPTELAMNPRERYRSRRAALGHSERKSWKRHLAADHWRDSRLRKPSQ
jgi:hypothetical protein